MKTKLRYMDKTLFILMIVYTILGLVMIFSASSISAVLQNGVNESYFFFRQLVFILLAYAIGLIILFISNKKITLIKKCSKFLGILSIVLLLLTLIFGTTVNSAKSWLGFGLLKMQTAEFAKTLLILSIAFYFKDIDKVSKNYRFLTPFSFVAISAYLIYKQPDLGTAIIVVLTSFLMFLSLPLKDEKYKKIKIVAGIMTILVAFLFFTGGDFLKKFLHEEQYSRLTYKNPCTRYTEKTGYQVCNGYIAINNGGLFGVGLGNSTQKYMYLPEAYTDFIFPIIVEELGSIPGAIIIIGFIIILLRLFIIARNSVTLSGSLITYGTFSLILSHLLINLLGVLAIIPLTGVPLPLLSYGGSFAFNVIILIFMSLRVSIENNKLKLSKEINNLTR